MAAPTSGIVLAPAKPSAPTAPPAAQPAQPSPPLAAQTLPIKVAVLRDMGFGTDIIQAAINQCGPEAPVEELLNCVLNKAS